MCTQIIEDFLDHQPRFISNGNENGRRTTKKPQKQLKGIVNVMLVGAEKLQPIEKLPNSTIYDPFCKLLLGKKEKKSKVCLKTLNPCWRETLSLNWYEGGNNILAIQIHSGLFQTICREELK